MHTIQEYHQSAGNPTLSDIVGRKDRGVDLDLIVHDHIEALFLAFHGAGDTPYPGADDNYLERRGWVVAGHL